MFSTTTEHLNQKKKIELFTVGNKIRSQVENILIEHPLPTEKDMLKTNRVDSFFDFMSDRFNRLQSQIRDKFGNNKLAYYNKLICLNFLLSFDDRKKALPQSIDSLYPTTIEYIADSLISDEMEGYGLNGEFFIKDLRLLSLQSFPGGAQIIDQSSYLHDHFYRYMGVKENLRRLFFMVFKLGGLGPLFRIHTDTRYLDDFNYKGWNECYLRIVDLLKQRIEVKGMIATSWFYDPQLVKISPHLRYLREVPCDNGAFLIIDGPGDIHTKRAIQTSKTRRKLYQEGKYTPTCCTLIWSRKKMIKWSERYNGD